MCPEVRHASLTRRRPFSKVVTSDASTTPPRIECETIAFAGGSTISGGPPAKDGGAHAHQRALSSSFSSSVSFAFVSTQRHAATPPSSCTARSASGVFAFSAAEAPAGTKTTRDTGDAPWKDSNADVSRISGSSSGERRVCDSTNASRGCSGAAGFVAASSPAARAARRDGCGVRAENACRYFPPATLTTTWPGAVATHRTGCDPGERRSSSRRPDIPWWGKVASFTSRMVKRVLIVVDFPSRRLARAASQRRGGGVRGFQTRGMRARHCGRYTRGAPDRLRAPPRAPQPASVLPPRPELSGAFSETVVGAVFD